MIERISPHAYAVPALFNLPNVRHMIIVQVIIYALADKNKPVLVAT